MQVVLKNFEKNNIIEVIRQAKNEKIDFQKKIFNNQVAKEIRMMNRDRQRRIDRNIKLSESMDEKMRQTLRSKEQQEIQ